MLGPEDLEGMTLLGGCADPAHDRLDGEHERIKDDAGALVRFARRGTVMRKCSGACCSGDSLGLPSRRPSRARCGRTASACPRPKPGRPPGKRQQRLVAGAERFRRWSRLNDSARGGSSAFPVTAGRSAASIARALRALSRAVPAQRGPFERGWRPRERSMRSNDVCCASVSSSFHSVPACLIAIAMRPRAARTCASPP